VVACGVKPQGDASGRQTLCPCSVGFACACGVAGFGKHELSGAVRHAGKVGIFSGNTMQYMMALQAGNYYNTVVGAQFHAVLAKSGVVYQLEVLGQRLHAASS